VLLLPCQDWSCALRACPQVQECRDDAKVIQALIEYFEDNAKV